MVCALLVVVYAWTARKKFPTNLDDLMVIPEDFGIPAEDRIDISVKRIGEVEKVSHRRYSTGFFYGEPGQYVDNSRYIREYQVCAVVTGHTPDGLAKLSLRNKFAAGDTLELVGPDVRPIPFTAPQMLLPDGTPISEPRVPQMELLMRLPRPVPELSILRRQVDLSAKET